MDSMLCLLCISLVSTKPIMLLTGMRFILWVAALQVSALQQRRLTDDHHEWSTTFLSVQYQYSFTQ